MIKRKNKKNEYVIEGDVVIGKNVTIYPGSILKNCTIGDNSIIINSVIEDSNVKENCKIGPYSHIRCNTIIEKNVKIGHCCEVKNSLINEGTKIAHLSYIGDSIIGKNVNFGAGSVTANYDGTIKNKTIVEDNVMIGCNSVLIAPIKIEENSYVAAGSTVTKNIKKDSLVIARNRETIKENYFKKNIL